MSSTTGQTPPPTASKKTPKKAAASGFIGSVLEYYDFAMYAQAAAIVFPTVFFPTDNAALAVIASLGTYAVGYVARPIGAIVLGHWGDRIGRKSVLVFAMFLMGASTFAVGLLPSYAAIGALAPVLLICLRLVQGFAVAGELSGASAMIIEHSPAGRRGYFASFPLQGTQAGSALGAAVFIPLELFMPEDMFYAWGWRIPFFLSAIVVFAAYMIRRKVDESPEFMEKKAHMKEERKLPVVEVFRRNWRTVILAIIMSMVNVIGTTVIVFGGSFATQESYGVSMDPALYLWIPVLANLVAIATIPVFGALSDRLGRRPLMIAGSVGSAVFVFPYLYAIKSGNVVLTAVLAMLLIGVFFQMWNAVFASYFQELFPADTRVTGFAISQNVGLSLVAFTPSIFAVAAPPGSDNVPLIAGGVCVVILVLAIIATLMCPETNRMRIEDLGVKGAQPMSKDEYAEVRREAFAAGSSELPPSA